MSRTKNIITNNQKFESSVWFSGIPKFNLVTVEAEEANTTLLFPTGSPDNQIYTLQNIGEHAITIRVDGDKYPIIITGDTDDFSSYLFPAGETAMFSYDNSSCRLLISPMVGVSGEPLAVMNGNDVLSTAVNQIKFDGISVSATLDSPGGTAVTVSGVTTEYEVQDIGTKNITVADIGESFITTIIDSTTTQSVTYQLPNISSVADGFGFSVRGISLSTGITTYGDVSITLNSATGETNILNTGVPGVSNTYTESRKVSGFSVNRVTVDTTPYWIINY